MEHIVDNDTDIAFLSETWMTDDKNDITATIDSYGYKLAHNRRKNRDRVQGGGVGIMLKKSISTKQINIRQFNSFDHTIVNMKTKENQVITLISIYRLLFIPTMDYLLDFQSLLEVLCSAKEMFVIAGDINIHLDNVDSIYTKQFDEILLTFNVTQHIKLPTHIHGHTIDVVITRTHSPIIQEIRSNNVELSHRFLLQFSLKEILPSKIEYKEIQYRYLKGINNHSFCEDIKEAFRNIHSNSLPEKLSSFHTKAKNIEFHAPLKTKNVKSVATAPWFDEEYNILRRQRRKAEKRYKVSKSDQHKSEFVNLRKDTTAFAYSKKRAYFTRKIDECNGNSKSLHSCLNSLLDQNQITVLPSYDSSKELAE